MDSAAKMQSIAGFEWDEHNVSHIARHGVSPEEVEQAIDNGPVIVEDASETVVIVKPDGHEEEEDRTTCVGVTDEGRLLWIVFTIRSGLLRTITAHTAKRKRRKEYAKEFGFKAEPPKIP